MRRAAPGSEREMAAALAQAADAGEAVRVRGGATKLGWGRAGMPPTVELTTGGLTRIVEHNTGDYTAVVEAGVPLADAQAAFEAAGQMVALDPPDLGGATVGGVVATADAGPLAHRYGTPRDLVLGIAVALTDGTVARSGGKVIKNVAGYDLGKLFAGSFGTLGAILSVSLRLHPLPRGTATVQGRAADPEVVAAGARALTSAPLEPLALDVRWSADGGAVLARLGAAAGAARAAALLREAGLEVADVADEEAAWAAQRAAQRAPWAGDSPGPSGGGDGDLAVVRVAMPPSRLAALLRAVGAHGGTVVGRAALGIHYVTIPAGAVAALRADLPDRPCVVLDAPPALREAVDPWGVGEGPELALMRRVKARFDPTGACSPGRFAGGI